MKDNTTDKPGYGGYYSVGETGGLRGRKRSLFKGGVHVHFILRWPAHTPAGVKNDATLLTAVDLIPTLCAAAGITLPESYESDGENLIAAFKGEPVRRTRLLAAPRRSRWRLETRDAQSRRKRQSRGIREEAAKAVSLHISQPFIHSGVNHPNRPPEPASAVSFSHAMTS